MSVAMLSLLALLFAPAPASDAASSPERGSPVTDVDSPGPSVTKASTVPERDFTFSPGVQLFVRGEERVRPDFGATDALRRTDVVQRTRIQLLSAWGPLRALVQAQDARVWGFEPSTASNDANTDLHQGWLELGGRRRAGDLEGSIRVGRQELSWGGERLIGAFGWNGIARSFDAVRVRGRAKWVGAEVFGAVLDRPRRFAIDLGDGQTRQVTTSGHYVTGALLSAKPIQAVNVEALVLGDFAGPSQAAPTRSRTIGNAGARVWGKPIRGLSYDVEGYGQFGKVGGLEHVAWAWASKLGYTSERPSIKPGVHAGYAMASGSACTPAPTGGDAAAAPACGEAKSRDFFNFYPTNHGFYGLVDQQNWSNVRNLEVGMSASYAWVRADVTFHHFQLQESTGRWTNAGGGLVGQGWDPANRDNSLGQEIDATVKLTPWSPLMVQAGYGVFIPTQAGVQLAGPRLQHFAWLWIVATFGRAP